MNKFKKIMLGALSILTLGLFVTTGAKVNAATVELFKPTAAGSKSEANAYIIPEDNNYISLQSKRAYQVVALNSGVSYEYTEGQSTKQFSYAAYNPDGNTNSSSTGFTLTAKQAGKVVFYFTMTDSSRFKSGGCYASTFTFSNSDLDIVTEEYPTSSVSSANPGQAYKLEINMTANQTTDFYCSTSRRPAFFEIDFVTSSNVSVTFKDGETTLDTKSLGSGTTITYAPEDKDDAVFNGWVDSDSNPVTTVPSSAVTLYATWTPKRTITFKDDDKTTTLDTKVLGQGHTINYVPEKTGYTFVGWFDGEDNAVTTVPSSNATLYAKWSRNPVSGNGTTLSTDDLTVSGTSQQYDSDIIFDGSIYTVLATQTVPVTVYSDEKTIGGVTYSKYVQFGGSSKFNKDGYARLLKIDAKFGGKLLVSLQSNSSADRTVTLYDSNATATSQVRTVTGTGGVYTYDLEANQTYYIYSSGDLRIFHAEFVSTPDLEQQENSTGTAIRYIATVKGVTSNALITSWTVTMSIDIDGKADYTADFTELYTAVGGNNGKSAADDTVYLVGTLQNIPAKFNGRTISTTIIVTLSNSTTLTSNTVNYLINIPTND